jgi:hypothetical protein
MNIFSFRLFIYSLLLFFCPIQHSKAQCKVSDIVADAKIAITEPYLYDGFSMTQFVMDKKEKKMQVEFIALKHQEYKLCFRTSAFDEELNICVTNADNDTILNIPSQKEKTIVFEVKKAGNYKVEYKIPTCENAEYGNIKNECILMLIAYKRK